MENSLTNEYIGKAVDELAGVLGVKDNIDYSEMIALIRNKKVKEGIQGIASHLGLPVKVSPSSVSDDYQANYYSGFQSRRLTPTDSRKRGVAGIIAQVDIPNDLPIYDSPRLNSFNITVKVSENCNSNPETLIAVVAHELSHILLHTIRHPKKDNEFYTDLVPILLGFSSVIEKGRKVIRTREIGGNSTETSTSTYGYLTDNQFSFASKRTKELVESSKNLVKNCMSDVLCLKKQSIQTRNAILQFQELIALIGKNRSKSIPPDDAIKLVTFHQVGYTEGLEKAVNENRKQVALITKYCTQLQHYTKGSTSVVSKHRKQIENLSTKLSNLCSQLENDIKILSKYVGLWSRLKIRMKVRIHSGNEI